MSRRKHLEVLQQSIEVPALGQHLVRAIGSRGSNLIEVEYPDGRSTLCLLPAKFHKKLWIKKGNYLYIEDVKESDSRVTGQIVRVLFEDDVKALRKIDGIWPKEFEHGEASCSGICGQLVKQDVDAGCKLEVDESGSDDDLPPLEPNKNRRVIEYAVSETESDSE